MSRPRGPESTREFNNEQAHRFAELETSGGRGRSRDRIRGPIPTTYGPDNSPITPS